MPRPPLVRRAWKASWPRSLMVSGLKKLPSNVPPPGALPPAIAMTAMSFPSLRNRPAMAGPPMSEATAATSPCSLMTGSPKSSNVAPPGANQPAPGGATFEDFGDPVINEHGEVAAVASLIGGPAIAGLFRSDGNDIAVIAIAGGSAPGGGTFDGSFFKPLTINERGQLAFHARLTNGGRGIYRGDGTTTSPI